jgi:DNA-binding GntR family transcriptional regulator
MQNARKGSGPGSTRRGALRVQRPGRQIVTDGAYEALKRMIMDHHVEPGERLNMEELARQLDVSATPVREALARLESDGLVTRRALSGYAVAPFLDSDSLGYLFEIRHLLEPHAATKAARLASDDDLANLEQMVALMQADPMGADYDQYRGFAAHDTEFHALVARMSGNPVLGQTLSGLHFHWHLYRLHFETDVGVDTVAEHARIAAAIRARDAAGAAAAMREHLARSQERLVPAVQQIARKG